MTIQFHPNINNLMVYSIGSITSEGTNNPCISVYSGTQPNEASDIISGWSSNLYNTTNESFLAHYAGSGGWGMPIESNIVTLTSIPNAVTALHSGTASWAILWGPSSPSSPASILVSALGSTTIPSTAFMVVPVGTSFMTGVITFADLTFTQGVSKTILGGQIVSNF
jgi:hypothetical protein